MTAQLYAPSPKKPHTDQYGVIFKVCTDSPQVKSLNDSTFRVWVMFNVLVGGRRGGLTVSSEQLATACGMSRSTFFRCVKVLKQKKLLMCKKNGLVNGVVTNSNNWILSNPENVEPLMKGQPFGVNIGIEEKPNDSNQSQKWDGFESNSLHNTESSDSTAFSNEPQNDTPNNETEYLKKLEALSGFLGEQIKASFDKLKELPKLEAAQRIYKNEAQLQVQQFGRGDYSNLDEWWHIDWAFKDALVQFGPDCWGPEYVSIVESALRTFKPATAEKRAAFLTDCQQIVRGFGR